MKVRLKIQIKSEDNYINFDTNGILNDKTNILTYSEDKKTKVKLFFDKDKLVRENDEFIMTFCFIENKITTISMYMKELNQQINMDINTLKIIKKDKFYKVIYTIEDSTKNEYILELEK